MKPTLPLTDWDAVRMPLVEAGLREECEAEDRERKKQELHADHQIHIECERLEAFTLHPLCDLPSPVPGRPSSRHG